jgi:hypothetical protein
MASLNVQHSDDHAGRRRDAYLVKSVVRCSQVLRAFRKREDGLPLHTIAQRTGLSTTVVFRLLDTLRQIGWVEKRDRTYRLLVQVPRQKRRPT